MSFKHQQHKHQQHKQQQQQQQSLQNIYVCDIFASGAWRAKEAQRKRAILVRNKMEFIAARKLQGCFRIRMAHQKCSKLRKTVMLHKACCSIQRAFRSMSGRRKLVEMLNSFHPHTILATMQSATMTTNTGAFKQV